MPIADRRLQPAPGLAPIDPAFRRFVRSPVRAAPTFGIVAPNDKEG